MGPKTFFLSCDCWVKLSSGQCAAKKHVEVSQSKHQHLVSGARKKTQPSPMAFKANSPGRYQACHGQALLITERTAQVFIVSGLALACARGGSVLLVCWPMTVPELGYVPDCALA